MPIQKNRKPVKPPAGMTFADVIRQTGATIGNGEYVVKFNRLTERLELWHKDRVLGASNSEAEMAEKLISLLGTPDRV